MVWHTTWGGGNHLDSLMQSWKKKKAQPLPILGFIRAWIAIIRSLQSLEKGTNNFKWRVQYVVVFSKKKTIQKPGGKKCVFNLI